jgi:hypothetical protein
MSLHDYEHILIATSGGGPTALQRKKTVQFWNGKELPRFSLITESRAVIGIVSLFNWFIDNRLRAFRPDKTRDALDYLEVPPDERQALLDTASRLRLALGRQGERPADRRRVGQDAPRPEAAAPREPAKVRGNLSRDV